MENKIQKALDNYWIVGNCVFVKLGRTVYYEKVSRIELLKNKTIVENLIVGKNIKERIKYDLWHFNKMFVE